MKNILLTLSIIIIILCCKNVDKPDKLNHSLPKNTVNLKINPKSFIPNLNAELSENSGLIFYDNLLWTINDSGGKNKIYAFDFSGKIKKEIEIEGAKNIDWEEIAQDKKHIYIGDFGNNNNTRKNLRIYQIKKKDINNKAKQKVEKSDIEFNYGDQKDFDFQFQNGAYDCEAMVEFNDFLYIFTKNWSKRTTTVYKIEDKKGHYKSHPLDSMNVTGLITGADISPDKSKLALIGYKNFKPILWLFSGITPENIFGKTKTFIEMDSILNAQTEGICFINNDSLLISCEQNAAYNSQVFLFDLTTVNQNGTHKSK